MNQENNYIYFNEEVIKELYHKAIDSNKISSEDFKLNNNNGKWQKLYNEYMNSKPKHAKE